MKAGGDRTVYHLWRAGLCLFILVIHTLVFDFGAPSRSLATSQVAWLFLPCVASFLALKVWGARVGRFIGALATAWTIATSVMLLAALYLWYSGRDGAHFEPLALLFAGSIAAIEFCRREAIKAARDTEPPVE